jgi:hypothetical protein
MSMQAERKSESNALAECLRLRILEVWGSISDWRSIQPKVGFRAVPQFLRGNAQRVSRGERRAKFGNKIPTKS